MMRQYELVERVQAYEPDADERWFRAWEPFATAMVYYGPTGLSIGEAAINAVGSVVVWRCVVEPSGGAS